MTIASITEGRDAIAALFKAAWAASGSSSSIEVLWDDRGDAHPATDVAWVRVTIQHTLGRQSSLGSAGTRRFNRLGIVTVQIFTPAGEGLTQNDVLSRIAHEAFEGNSTASDAVRFFNVSTREIGIDGSWFQTNVTAEFEYDVVR